MNDTTARRHRPAEKRRRRAELARARERGLRARRRDKLARLFIDDNAAALDLAADLLHDRDDPDATPWPPPATLEQLRTRLRGLADEHRVADVNRRGRVVIASDSETT